MPDQLIYIDTETGDLTPGKAALLSIAVVTEAGAEFHTRIMPVPGMIIHPNAVKKNGYRSERWADAVSPWIAAEMMRDFLDSQKKEGHRWQAVAHNAGFDRGFVDWLSEYTSVPFDLDHRWECTQAIYADRIRNGLTSRTSASLDSLCAETGHVREFEVWDGREYHGALGDAKACRAGHQWLRAQMQRLVAIARSTQPLSAFREKMKDGGSIYTVEDQMQQDILLDALQTACQKKEGGSDA